MKCKFTKEENLSAYVDGELEHIEMQEIADHIKTCSECREFVEEFEMLSANSLMHYEELENSFELPNLMSDLNKRLLDMDSITNEHVPTSKVIEFPKKKESTKEELSVLGKIYNFAPAVISLAAIFLVSFIISTGKPNVTAISSQAKTNDGVTIDSLEYSKFNAMIYKTKEKNKTVIWLFKENNSDDEDNGDGPI